MTRYLSPLSSDETERTSRAHRTYSEMENSSSATNSVTKPVRGREQAHARDRGQSSA